jgi:hypothetical protein
MTDYERWRRRRAGLDDTGVLRRGSPGFDIVPEIAVAEPIARQIVCQQPLI